MSVGNLRPYAKKARTHSKKQIKQIAQSIERFGFTNPVLISNENEIIAGHGRVEAAKLLGIESVLTLRLSHLTETQRRAYVIADNKLAQNAGWDRDVLAIELQALIDIEFDIELTGFSLAEVDILLDDAKESSPGAPAEAEDEVPPLPDENSAVTRLGDIWSLGRHRLVCGDSRNVETVSTLMGDERADLIFTDPPYNVPIDGHVSGLGQTRHREFAMAAGEMSSEAFTAFLREALGNAAATSRGGAIAFVCMDWRQHGRASQCSSGGVLRAEEPLRLEQDKRPHGLVLSLQARSSSLCSRSGRHRTRTPSGLAIPGAIARTSGTTPASTRSGLNGRGALNAPDCEAGRSRGRRHQRLLETRRDGARPLWWIWNNPHCGREDRPAGTLIEFDPVYCDQIIQRFEKLTGKQARLAITGESFEDIAEERRADTQIKKEEVQ